MTNLSTLYQSNWRKYALGKRAADIVSSLFAFVIFAALTVNTMDRDYEFMLEADFSSSLPLIKQYSENFLHLSFGGLPRPSPYPYFDGSYITYGAVDALLKKIGWLLPKLTSFITNADSRALLAAELTNAIARAVASGVFYRSMVRAGTGPVIAFILALLLCLSPQMLDIGLARIDHLVLVFIVIVFHVSLILTLNKSQSLHAIALGIAMAFLVTLKITGVLFAALPVLAVASVQINRRERKAGGDLIRFTILSTLPFLIVVAILMGRFWTLGFQGFVSHYLASVADIQQWSAIMGMSPKLYYNVDLFSGYGIFFLAVVFACSLVVAIRAALARNPTSIFLTASLILFSLLGIASFKYGRGGYHLVPIYLAEIGFAVALWRSALAHAAARWRALPVVIAVLVLCIPTSNVWAIYLGKVMETQSRAATIDKTRRQPRIWLMKNVHAGARVCLMRHSEWASVPLDGLGLQVTYGPLDIPYLKRDAMAQYPIPSAAQIASACDLVILNNFHTDFYASAYQRYGLDARWTEWAALIAEMAILYPPIVFASENSAYGVSRIEIYDLRAASPES